MYRHLLLIVAVLLLCCGCKAPEMQNVQSWVGLDEPQGKFIDRFREPEPCDAAPADQSASTGQAVSGAGDEGAAALAEAGPGTVPAGPVATIAIPEKALVGQRLTIGVARNQAIENYLNSVLEKLQQAWPGEPVPSYVFLRPDPGFGAHSMDQAIFVNYGTLRALESEDEVAALLAHEYSHVLLGHASLQDWSELLGLGVEVYQTVASVKYQTSGDTDNLIKDAVLSVAADKVSQDAFLPVFSRENEEEADALGTDLLLASGYSPMGMVNLLQRVASWDEQLAQREEERRKAEEEARKEAEGDKAKFSLDKMFADLGKATAKLGSQHYPATERIQTVKAYVRAQYAGAPRNALQAEPYRAVFDAKAVGRYFGGLDDMESAKVNLLSEKPKDALTRIRSSRCKALMEDVPYVRLQDRRIAIANGKGKLDTLEADCARDDTLLDEYLLLIAANEDKDPAKALTVAAAAYDSLDKAEILLPDLIRLNKKVGDNGKSLAYFAQCKTSGISELVSRCQNSLETKKAP